MTTLEARRVRSPRAEPERRTADHSWRRRALLGVLFAGLVVLMMRPTWHSLTKTLPEDLGDSSYVTWALGWDNHALFAQPGHLFDANIYYPNHLTLAYSENLLSLAPVFGLVHAVSGSWALSLNLTILSLLVLSLGATYSLTRWLTGRTDAGVLAAIAFTFSGFVLTQLEHPQLISLGFFPLAFLLLFRTLEERRLGIAALAGLVNAALVLSALYYGAIFSVCAVVIVGGYLVARRFRPGRGFVTCLLVTGAVTAVLVVPNALLYLRLQNEVDLTRPYEPGWGLKAVDLVSPAPGSLLYPGLAEAADKRPFRGEHAFFPGFSVMALAVVGLGVLVIGPRRRAVPDDEPAAAVGSAWTVAESRRLHLTLLTIAAAVCVVIAAGPSVFGQPAPFRFFYHFWPGFNGVRVAARLFVPAMLTGAVLAGFGFAALTSRLRPGRRAALAVALGAFVLLEFAAPGRRAVLPTDHATLAVYHELARRPAGAVVELPIIDPRKDPPGWAYVEGPRMVYSTLDFHPRVNGYSGYWPPDYLANLVTLDTFPSPAALARAKELRLRYVVLHVGVVRGFKMLTEQQATAALAVLPPGATARRYGDAWLVDLGPPRSRRR